MSVTVPSILKYLSKNATHDIFEDDMDMDMPSRPKKRRLDHLTWEQKLQRKKLKNRVAAQTSRDRKKAKMEQMEHALQELFAKNEALMVECKELRNSNKKLLEENAQLTTKLTGKVCIACSQSLPVECRSQHGSAESTPLPQGLDLHSAAALKKQQLSTVLLKIVLACLLYRTCSTSSTETWTSSLLKNSPRAFCRISPQTWKVLLKRQIVRNQTLMNNLVQEKWWGRHQNTWNPVETAA